MRKKMMASMATMAFVFSLAAGCGGGSGSTASTSTTDSTTTPPAPIFETNPPPATPLAPVVAPPNIAPPAPIPAPPAPVQPLAPIPEPISNPNQTAWIVNGIPGGIITDGSSIFASYGRLGDAYVSKINEQGSGTEIPSLITTNTDKCSDGVYLNGYTFLLCTQAKSDFTNIAVWFEKINVTDGSKSEKVLLSKSYPAGLTADSVTGMLYSAYTNESGAQFAIQLDQDGTIIQGAPRISPEEFSKLIVIGSDGVYFIGRIMQSGSLDRIYVIKFSKDLQTRLWSAQYRNFSDSSNLDLATGAVLSPSGTLIVGGITDSVPIVGSGIESKSVLLEFNPANGTLLRSWSMASTTKFENLIFDASGALYTSSPVSKFNLGTGQFTWNSGITGSYMTMKGNTLYSIATPGPANPSFGQITLINTATGAKLN